MRLRHHRKTEEVTEQRSTPSTNLPELLNSALQRSA